MTRTPQPRFLQTAFDGAVATLTLSRPSMNTIDDDLLVALDAALDDVVGRPGIGLLRIRSDQRVFSAGADLALVAARLETDAGANEMKATVQLFHRVYDRLECLPMVTIAEIEGHALGGGLELALACDIRIASTRARLGLPEVKVGLLPGAGGTQRLTRLCGIGVASRIILTGDVVDGREAERLGLVQWAFEADMFRRGCDDITARTAGLARGAQALAKQCIGLANGGALPGAAAEIAGIHTLMRRDETRARVRGFLKT